VPVAELLCEAGDVAESPFCGLALAVIVSPPKQ